MKKIIFLLVMLFCIIGAKSQDSPDPQPHAYYMKTLTEEFNKGIQYGDIIYVHDTELYYKVLADFSSDMTMTNVISLNQYYTLDSTFFASSGTTTINANLDSVRYLLEQNNTYQDSIYQKLGTSVATPITYTVPSQGSSYTWTSEASLTVSGMPMVISGDPQVVSITGVNSVPDSNRLYIQGQGISISYSGDVITITGATETVPLPRTSQYAISFCGAQFALDMDYNAFRAIILNALQGISTGYLSAISDFEDESAATYSYAIPVGASNYNYADGYIKIYSAAAPDTVFPDTYITFNPDAVTTDLTDWLNVTTLMGFDTVTATTDSIPWTLQDIYDNGYGVPERLMFRFRVVGGNDNAITDFYRTYSIK